MTYCLTVKLLNWFTKYPVISGHVLFLEHRRETCELSELSGEADVDLSAACPNSDTSPGRVTRVDIPAVSPDGGCLRFNYWMAGCTAKCWLETFDRVNDPVIIWEAPENDKECIDGMWKHAEVNLPPGKDDKPYELTFSCQTCYMDIAADNFVKSEDYCATGE